ncbi:hypothetical protein PV11_07424 [Exophiala sideris]|uniref:Uncharacterized protein n=1 Tax=Exophiala sideris TaxID=1016849 RepID=A0A0D1YYM8_9EURO|nr:hypothetical protein PV11_07424 [Exophiala sideris]
MGLPMFREPEEIPSDQPAAKLEQIAATRRSTIRRESSIRPGRTYSSRSLLERIRDGREIPGHEAEQRNNLPPSRISEREINVLDAELSRLRSRRQRRSRANQLDRELSQGPNRNPVRHESEQQTNMDLDALTDAGIEVFFSDGDGNLTQHLPRPSRESNLRFEVAANSQSQSDQPRRTRFYSARASRGSSPSGRRAGAVGSPWSIRAGFDDGDDNGSENVTLTPGFAPAQGPYRAGLDGTSAAIRIMDDLMDTPPPEGLEASYPPLRRVNHMSPRPVGTSTSRMDGLGDRLRSPSLGAEAHEEENWSNLQATMEPGRSSTATSFMSSRSDSQTVSNRSSQTTATSFGEIGGDDTCDLDLPSGITEDDVREIRARHGRLRRHLPLPDDLSHSARQHIPGGNEWVSELEVFGVILDRMQRREEIPDEWWAAVGLSPDVVRGGSS